MGIKMTYTQAVSLALSGDSAGFDFLYNATKSNKYYLALKYVKNEEVAKDVLQDAYIRAWKNLDKLKEPEKFDSWLAQIVVNTAKNELEKRNHTPLDLRADAGEDEDDTEIFDRAVSSWDNVPELEYTKEETRQLVHELIDSLSDEQRLVVIAFELEGLTTKEIAQQLGCSEATVKSRLRYGRNNIKEKAEELQKKGYKLYSIAPLPLLLYLLRKESGFVAAEPATQAVLSECGRNLLNNGQAPHFPQTVKALGDATSAARKAAFLSTTAGKAVVAVTVLTVAVAGTAAGFIHHNRTAPVDNIEEEETESLEESVERIEESNEESIQETEEIVSETIPETEESAEPEETLVQDEVGWTDAYSMILKHIPDHSLNTVSEVGLYGFDKEIYDNLTEEGEQFEYALVDLDKDGIPELLIRANTSQTTYNGMSYWMIATYKKSIIDGNYVEMPVMVQGKQYPVTEGVASVGGSRVFVTMNEDMDEFFIISKSASNGDSHTYIGRMEYDTGLYWWREEETGYYTWEQEDALNEAAKAYPVEIEWHPINESLELLKIFAHFKSFLMQ